MEFKVGDKVKYKNYPDFIGYVSGVDKGQLFLKKDFIINVHIGNGDHIFRSASELEVYKDE